MLSELQPIILIIIGLGFLAVSIFKKTTTNTLRKYGVKVEGIILNQREKTDVLSYKHKIIVRFLPESQEWITKAIDQDFQISYPGQYKDGQQITVYYDKTNPDRFVVESGQSSNNGRIVFALVGIFLAVAGLYEIL